MPEAITVRGSFPIVREERYLTRANRLEDFTEYRSPEFVKPLYRWEIEADGRTTTEVQALENTFLALGGRYNTFVFLDPLENLLLWSEDFGQAVWQKSAPASLSILRDQPDPLGGAAAQWLTNSSGSANSVTQYIAAPPASLELTGSVWLKAQMPVTLAVTDGVSESYSTTVEVGVTWTRFSARGVFSSGNGSSQVGFRFDVPAGATLHVFGAQLMPLQAAGAYVRTTTVSGFHPRCRFSDGVFAHRLAGSGHSDLRLSIVELA